MRVEIFEPDSHLHFLNLWLSLRGLKTVEPQELPEVGFVAVHDGRYIAANFLRRCEGNVAIMDSLVTNPQASSSLRHKAIELVVERAIRRSKKLSISRIIGFSIDEGTLKRSEKHGFVRSPFSLITLDLNSQETVH